MVLRRVWDKRSGETSEDAPGLHRVDKRVPAAESVRDPVTQRPVMIGRSPAVFALAAGLLLALPTAGGAAGDIVDTTYVKQALSRGAILWDVRSAEDYAAGHIPGAVNIGRVWEALAGPDRETPVAAAVAETTLGNAGIDVVGREVIAYGRKSYTGAHYAVQLMRSLGAKRARVFHGGLDDWQAAGGTVDTVATRLAPVRLRLKPLDDPIVWTADVEAALGRRGVQIVDVRTPDEYTGKTLRSLRGGHVPGAVNIRYEENWVDPEAAAKLGRKETESRDGMALRPQTELRQLYAGLDPGKETIVYCQGGARASLTANVLRSLGFSRVRLYRPSWGGYAMALSAPAADETFFDFGGAERDLASLKTRIADLEAQVDSLRQELQSR